MATNKNTQEREFVRCMDCRNATYMQWFDNPVVAQCSALEERMVAGSSRLCKLYVARGPEKPVIKHYDSYDEVKESQRRAFFEI